MKLTELRIGNIVNKYEEPHEISVWDFDNISTGITIVDPIPLTEQWLKDFGFEKNTHSGWGGKADYIIDDFWTILFFGEKIRFGYDEIDEGHITLCDIKYVHQLQNLYFALTGKELNK